MRQPLRIFIGYDSREPAAFAVCAHSILARAKLPVSIAPLTQPVLRSAGIYHRERDATESTEFSITRFLVPALCDFKGHALFMDCDMLVQGDITELWLHGAARPDLAVHVCQHDYTPKASTKFLGQTQTAYPRKNWSSLMLFNAERCQALTPEYVNRASGLELHRFQWIAEAEIGALPLEWNWLVGEYARNDGAKNYHFTNGGPWFKDSSIGDHADRWYAERDAMVGRS